MASTKVFDSAVESRRTYYQLEGKSPISDARIQEIITHAIKHVPSSFNSQSTRIIFLAKEEHKKLWDITKDILKGIVPGAAFSTTEKKLDSFKGAYGTVSPPTPNIQTTTYNPGFKEVCAYAYKSLQILFFDDRTTIKSFQEKFALYADKFPIWATESNGMHQFAIWTALEAEGMGANLQHYNPLIDAKIQAEWNIPETWELSAELVIGTPAADPYPKTFLPVEDRFKTYGV